MKRLVIASLLSLPLPLVAVAPAPAAPAERAAPVVERRLPPTGLEYVALGDSWTANVILANRDGTPDSTYAPIDCGQSYVNYPKLLAEALSVGEFRDASCGSATTDDFYEPQTGLPAGGTNPPQFDRLTRTTDLVTVGIGGNDAGIASAGLDCLNGAPAETPLAGQGPGTGGCKATYTSGGEDQISKRIEESEIKLVRAFRAIHRIAPGARILAIDYFDIVPDHGCYPTVPASDEDMAWIAAKFRELNAMIKRAARRGGAEFVNTFRRTPEGHDLCADPNVRWGETFGPSANDPAMGIPAHPNTAGARGQAAAIVDHLRDTDPDVYR